MRVSNRRSVVKFDVTKLALPRRPKASEDVFWSSFGTRKCRALVHVTNAYKALTLQTHTQMLA